MTTEIQEEAIHRVPATLCENCLMAERTGVYDVAPGRGQSAPQVVFISEYPTENEVETGSPFSGEAGFLFHSILSKLDETVPGAEAIRAYEDNALICSPERNEEGQLDQELVARSIIHCRPRLIALLEELKPEIIVLMGGIAVRSLLPDKVKTKPGAMKETTGVVKNLWKIHRSPFLNFPHRMLVTYNPSSILRFPEQFRTYAETLELAARLLTEQTGPLSPPETFIAQSLEDVAYVLDTLKDEKWIATDLETSDLSPYTGKVLSIGFSQDVYHTYLVPWRLITECEAVTDEAFIQTPNEEQKPYFEAMKDFIEDQTRQHVLHNASFDESYLKAQGIGIEPGKAMRVGSDPMLFHYALDERTGPGTGHGLKPLATQYYGAEDWEGI